MVLIIIGILLGFPLLGSVLGGPHMSQYFEFPPKSLYIKHAPFSWFIFFCYILFIFSAVTPLSFRLVKALRRFPGKRMEFLSFPWWGWLGFLAAISSWVLAWARFDWFSIFQAHTFTPLWISYILVINAMTYRKKGRCMMLNRPAFFLSLFPFSSLFWWFFEYLNRFVQNWHYVGVNFTPCEYFWYSTLSFSTVLPAVLGTREWLLTFPLLNKAFVSFCPIKSLRSKALACTILFLSSLSLACTGIWPDYLFPLLWISPLLVIVSVQVLMDKCSIFDGVTDGDWRIIISSACSALLCGFFWEMWNYYSLAKWEYTVSYVHAYQIFEMPVLGYAGYLPFELEGAAVGDMIDRTDVLNANRHIQACSC